MRDAVDSTWSCISCRGGRAEVSAWTAATTPQAATATTARRAFTGTWLGPSLTDAPAKVRVGVKQFCKLRNDILLAFSPYLQPLFCWLKNKTLSKHHFSRKEWPTTLCLQLLMQTRMAPLLYQSVIVAQRIRIYMKMSGIITLSSLWHFIWPYAALNVY